MIAYSVVMTGPPRPALPGSLMSRHPMLAPTLRRDLDKSQATSLSAVNARPGLLAATPPGSSMTGQKTIPGPATRSSDEDLQINVTGRSHRSGSPTVSPPRASRCCCMTSRPCISKLSRKVTCVRSGVMANLSCESLARRSSSCPSPHSRCGLMETSTCADGLGSRSWQMAPGVGMRFPSG